MFGRTSTKQADLEFFTIYDSKTQSYETPTQAVNKHDLIRALINLFKDPTQRNNKFLLNAEDYSVYQIGSFDRKTGLLSSSNLEHVVNLHDLRALAEPMPHHTRDISEVQPGIVPT